MDLELLRERARILQNIRRFFTERGYLELDTPALSPALIPETCLEVFKTDYIKPGTPQESTALYLVPSPEVYIKRIIAQHKVDVFQLSKCYRNGESSARIHSPEFTMLEYYTMNADYKDSMEITERLFDFLLPPPPNGQNRSTGGENCSAEAAGTDPWDFLRPPFIRLTMDDAFERYAGFRLSRYASVQGLAEQARRLELGESTENPFDTWGIDDLYELIFVHAVEPNLPCEKPVFLTDYPAFVPCLAKDCAPQNGLSENGAPETGSGAPDAKNGALWKERWELYARGIELANCYTEEQNPERVHAYFEKEGRLKEKTALVPHASDGEYWKIFNDFPSCSGVALGADRLIALLCGRTSIEPILPFPLEL
ncbi:amino acid--tRNA ligase-related protein [Treponema sp. HNW]|uniref:amino acid--tRNA ligase-related protein n=1 Tax=Treponema sp. HNW TaxID=3116654 RepID=UPI003D13E847